MSDLFDRDYYVSHCGDEPYLQSSEVWKNFFRPIADAIVLGLRPRKVFDAGCAVGFLVEALWDRGVEAHGRDISEFAISEVRADVRPWCEVGSIAAPVSGTYDLVLCIEVVEHMPSEEALAAIRNITSIAPRILFSSSPTDLVEETHINVRPTRYWLEQFASCGFAPVIDFDATFLTPHAVLFERSDQGADAQALTAFAEIVRQRITLSQERQKHAKATEALREALSREVSGLRTDLAQADAERAQALSEKHAIETRHKVVLGEAETLRSTLRDGDQSAKHEVERLLDSNATLSRTLAEWEQQLHRAEHQVSVSSQQAASHDRQRQKAMRSAESGRLDIQTEREARRLLASRLQAIERSASWRLLRSVQSLTAVPGVRRALQAIWWTSTFQLRRKMRDHRTEMALRGRIIESGVFDPQSYLKDNPDVAALGIDPLRHYMSQGWREGRRPGPGFDPQYYLASNPDVAATGADPLVHYIMVGKQEGREPRPVIDPLVQAVRDTGLLDESYYLANYPDIEGAGVDPASHYALDGWKEGRWPNADFDTEYYLESSPDVRDAGSNPLVHYAEFGLAEGRPTRRLAFTAPAHMVPDGPQSSGAKPARAYIASFNANWSALPVFDERRAPRTVTILTDSVDSHSLFGGVGTAIVIGALLARKLQARLRLATRTNPPDAIAVGRVLDVHRIDWQGSTDFMYVPHDGSVALPLGDLDLVMTTSWWTTHAARQSIASQQILYLLQEDERMFYPHGDTRLRCAETLSDTSLCKLINTRLLFDHLAQGSEALPSLEDHGFWFEPAFPTLPRPSVLPDKEKLDFFFYARPTNDRNLFWRGLEVVEDAVQNRVLPPERWNYHFVGRNIPDLLLPGGIRPIVSERLPWSDYARLVSGMDLGLCPMYTPHPSYPPLDLAACGAVVVTNTFGMKTSLNQWSDNIIAVAPEKEALGQALKQAVALVDDKPRRLQNCLDDRIVRDWNTGLDHVLSRLLSRMGVQ